MSSRFMDLKTGYRPDDVAFGPDGSWYWTSIMTGEVAGFNPQGEKVVAAQLTAGR